jgi:hypothetical protein
MTTITTSMARKRLREGKPVYADFFDTRTMAQQRVRVVKISIGRYDDGFTLQDINGGTSERLTSSRVNFVTA